MAREADKTNCAFLLVYIDNLDLNIYHLDLFTGMPICKGRVIGKARVVKTLEEANSIQVKGAL